MDGDDLVVDPLVVAHAHDADGVGPQQHAGGHLLAQHQHVERVVVVAVGARHKAVVGRVVYRAVQHAIDAQQARCLVQLVLHLRAHRDLDEDGEPGFRIVRQAHVVPGMSHHGWPPPRCQMIHQPVEEHPLIGVDQALSFLQGHETCLIDLPGGRMRGGVGRGRSGETEDALAALLIVGEAERLQRAGRDACFLLGFAAGRRFQVGFARVGDPLGDAPRGVAVVVAGGVDEQHLDAVAGAAIEQGAGSLFARGPFGHDASSG